MIITKEITMDLAYPGTHSPVYAVQTDRYSRNLKIHLLNNRAVYQIPCDAAVMIRFQKADGKGGEYDTMPDGTSAWSAEKNALTLKLAPQVLTFPGKVALSVSLIMGDSQLTLFPIELIVEPIACSLIEKSDHYSCVTGFLPAPEKAVKGQFFRVASVDQSGKVTKVEPVTLSTAEGVGKDGGYYTPAVTQTDENIIRFDFTPSKTDMAAVEPVQVMLPSSSGNADQGGLSAAAAELLVEILRNGVYSTDQSANITALAEALTVTEPDEPVIPDEPDEPEVPEATLSSISAVYSGGDVAVGTAVTDLTGIVVTAHYSDGGTETVTGYTLSGTIAEGNNTVTVSYGGKSTTFTVTGVAESGGETEGVVVELGEYGETQNHHGMVVYSDGGETQITLNGNYWAFRVSTSPFTADTKIKITIEKTTDTQFYDHFIIASADSEVLENPTLYYAITSGNETWVKSTDNFKRELEYTARAGKYLMIGSYSTAGFAIHVEVV